MTTREFLTFLFDAERNTPVVFNLFGLTELEMRRISSLLQAPTVSEIYHRCFGSKNLASALDNDTFRFTKCYRVNTFKYNNRYRITSVKYHHHHLKKYRFYEVKITMLNET